MARWIDPDNPDRNEWCPVGVFVLVTGDGVACGQFATVKITDGVWVCAEHAGLPVQEDK